VGSPPITSVTAINNERKTKMNITCKQISNAQRVNHTASVFGSCFPLTLEPVIYSITSNLSSEYCGGYWEFYELSNGGFYMSPDDDTAFTISSENGFKGTMSADALGVTACLYAYSHLSFSDIPEIAEVCARQFHLLREYMFEHAESRVILSAID
jgi:hypothetical protein